MMPVRARGVTTLYGTLLACIILAAPRAFAQSGGKDLMAGAEKLSKSVALGLTGRQSVTNALNAERQVRHLDSLPVSADEDKVIAHDVMADYYQTAHVPELVRYHARAVVYFAQYLDANAQRRLASIIFDGYLALAELRIDDGAPTDAAAILGVVPSDVAASTYVQDPLRNALGRISLVRRAAPPINSPDWINAAARPASITPDGSPSQGAHAATVIEFTAWWCGPCHDSYKYLRDASGQHPAHSVNVVLVTALMGTFRTTTHLSRPAEVAQLTNYFDNEEKLGFPIAVVDSTGPPVSAYYVDAYPEIIVVDGNGIVRAVLRGWDSRSDARLGNAINDALR